MPKLTRGVKTRLRSVGRSLSWAERRLKYSRGYLSRVLSNTEDYRSRRALRRVVALIEREERRQ